MMMMMMTMNDRRVPNENCKNILIRLFVRRAINFKLNQYSKWFQFISLSIKTSSMIEIYMSPVAVWHLLIQFYIIHSFISHQILFLLLLLLKSIILYLCILEQFMNPKDVELYTWQSVHWIYVVQKNTTNEKWRTKVMCKRQKPKTTKTIENVQHKLCPVSSFTVFHAHAAPIQLNIRQSLLEHTLSNAKTHKITH